MICNPHIPGELGGDTSSTSSPKSGSTSSKPRFDALLESVFELPLEAKSCSCSISHAVSSSPSPSRLSSQSSFPTSKAPSSVPSVGNGKL
jgi:hypothetical protein